MFSIDNVIKEKIHTTANYLFFNISMMIHHLFRTTFYIHVLPPDYTVVIATFVFLRKQHNEICATLDINAFAYTKSPRQLPKQEGIAHKFYFMMHLQQF